jgi:hypothetical protein
MLEFVTWFIWLGLFALLQRRFCRRYPGVRSLCRSAFLATMVVAILPAAWNLICSPPGAPHLLSRLNHYFGIGVYAQTSLQALIQLRWLAVAPAGFGFTLRRTSPPSRERQLLALMTALSQPLRGGRQKDKAAPRS